MSNALGPLAIGSDRSYDPCAHPHSQEVLRELGGVHDEMGDADHGDAPITIAGFSSWMMSTYASYLRDPSLVQDSISKSPDFIVYNQ